jgi:phytoene dehydrogenase-like protein
MVYDCIVVGAGMAGLTASAYLNKYGYKTLLLERQSETGGLVSTFTVKDFTFDGGIRAIENSGIVFPFLKDLGIELEFLESSVSLGVKDKVITIKGKEAVDDYGTFLKEMFSENINDIDKIMAEIKRIMKYLDILYGIDNPLFLDPIKDGKYFATKILPWMFKFAFTFSKIEKLSTPVDEYLAKFTDNQSLIDIIGQHFFFKTPTFFALSYFSLYLDYRYPKGGTQNLPLKVEEYVRNLNGEIKLETEIKSVDVTKKEITDQHGNVYHYKKLIWAGDKKSLYQFVDYSGITNPKQLSKIKNKEEELKEMVGGDSIFTVFMGVNLGRDYFTSKCTGHFFYTPLLDGLHDVMDRKESLELSNKKEVFDWVKDYFKYNTFEIAIPSLRDGSLAKEGTTAIVASLLFDYKIAYAIKEHGWYDEFKKFGEELMIDALKDSIFPELKENIVLQFSSTPLTIQSRTLNSEGAITGWAFTNEPIPAVTSLPGVARSVLTVLPDVYQAGQWSYSPSGLPIAILTGKLAADKVKKALK